MNRLLVLLFLALCLAPAFAAKVAILIGCNGYHHYPKLEGCVADVNAMKEALTAAGFDVYTMTGKELDAHGELNEAFVPWKVNIEQQLKVWAPQRGYGPGDTLLFYFSGHGVHSPDGLDYLAPLDGAFNKAADEQPRIDFASLLPMHWINEQLRLSGAENVFIITDACRSTHGKDAPTLGGFGAGAVKDIVTVPQAVDQRVLLLQSCTEDQRSYLLPDRTGSYFTHFLTQGLQGGAATDGKVTVASLCVFVKEQVRKSVAGAENEVQVPRFTFTNADPSAIILAEKPKAILPVRINPKDGAEMILIPAREFLMGSSDADKLASNGEKPKHKVYLDAYYIYKNDVTVAQYRKFCTETRRTMPQAPPWDWIDNHPVVNVTWADAKAYAAWAGAALPTEAQWEKAARGGDGRVFPWGNVWDAGKCNNSVRTDWHKNHTASVGSFAAGASPYGVLDMAGNVWQWCSDWYDENYYWNSPARNPLGPATGTERVLRGGAWFRFNAVFFRAAYRNSHDPTCRSNYYGFRCVCLVPGR